MTQKQSKPVVVHMDIRKLKPEPIINLPSLRYFSDCDHISIS
jgi:hypothetical protein